MARLADYFMVVGYDQEKAGKCWLVAAELGGSVFAVVDASSVSFSASRSANIRRDWKHFCFLPLNAQMFYTIQAEEGGVFVSAHALC